MKFQLKALVAALALVAAVPASAAIDQAVTGNGSFVLSVWDSVANISASFDLGKTYSEFSTAANASFANSGVNTAGTAFSWDLTSGDYASAWASFASVANEANASWAITAGDNLGSGSGSRGYITTYTGATFAALNTNGLVAGVGKFDVYVDNLGTNESLVQNHTTALNGANTAVTSKLSYSPEFYFGGRNFGTGPMSVGTVGSSLGLVQTLTGASGVNQVTNTIYSNANGISTFTLTSNGQLAYAAAVAAVPEPETYAMLLAGLGFMGFVARRKQAK